MPCLGAPVAQKPESILEASGRKTATATVEELISAGKTQLQQGQFDRARQTLESALKKSPDTAEAHYWLAKVFLAEKDLERGIAELERSIDLAPDNVRLRNELGLTYERVDRLEDAERQYQEILRRPTEDEKLTQSATKRLQLVQARRATEAGDHARALQEYEAALERYPDDWNVVELTAHAYNAVGRFKEADVLFGRVIKMQPDDAALRFRIAVVHAERGESERAQEEFAKAVELDPKGPVGRAALDRLGLKEGLDLMRENKPDEALKVLEGVLARVPNDPLTNLNAGILYQGLDRNADAEAAYKRTLAAAPDNVDASLRLGRLYEAAGRVDEAIEAFEAVVARAQGSPQGGEAEGRLLRLYARKTDELIKSLSISDKDIERAIQWGQRLFRRNLLDGAQQILSAVIDRDPANAQAQYWLGQVYIKRRELGEGISGIERSVELAPDNLRLRFELGLAYERANRLEEARRTYEYIIGQPIEDTKLMAEVAKRLSLVKARQATEAGDDARAAKEYESLLEQYPDDLNLMELTAHAYNTVGRYEEADALFDRVIKARPRDMSLRFRVAVVHEGRGETERAQEELAKVVELDPRGEVGRAALDRLGLKEGLDLMRENKLDQALAVLERVLSRVPNEPLTNLNAGILYQRLGRNAEAEAAYKRTLAAVPDNADASLRLGRLYEATGRVDEAIEALEAVVTRAQGSPQGREAKGRLSRLYDLKSRTVVQALESGTGDVEQAVTLGRHLYDSDQDDAAQRVLEAVVGRDPGNAEAYYWLAKLYLKAGQQAKGVATMERSVRLAPENLRLQEELGAAYERSRQLEAAQKVYEQALAKAKDEKVVARLTKRLGLLRARRDEAAGDKQGALRELQTLNEKFPNDPQLMQTLASAYESAGQTDEADRLFDSVIAQRPNSVPLRMRRAAQLVKHKRFPEAEAQSYGAIGSWQTLHRHGSL
jgi:tetratricopeptide (TPR) repeat protein